MNDSSEHRLGYGLSLDLGTMFKVAWRGRWRVISVAFAGAVLGATVSLAMKPVFRSQATLAPPATADDGGLIGLAGQLGGLGDLVGLDLGGRGNLDETLAFVTSRGFTVRFLRESQLEPLVFPDRWDRTRERWKSGGDLPLYGRVRDALSRTVATLTGDAPRPGPAHEGGPSDWDLVEQFEILRQVRRDKRTNIVTVSIAGRTAEATARLTNEFVAHANRQLRDRAIAESRRSIEYLSGRALDSQILAVNTALYRVLERELRTEMLASLHDDYALRVIDAAAPPKVRDSPRRTAITLASGFIGGFFGVLWIILRASRRREP